MLTKIVNRRGQEIAYEYNDKYQIIKETHSDGSTIEYEYGAIDGLLTPISNSSRDSITQVNYNQAENEISFSNFNLFLLTYAFDELGRKTQITIEDSTKYLNKINDKLGRVLI